MLRVEVRNAKPGMPLALPVRHPRVPKQVLLRVNYSLTSDDIPRLLELGVRTVWVRYPSLDFLERFVSQDVIAKQGEVFEEITGAFEVMQHQASAKLPYDSYCRSVGELVSNLVSSPQAAVFLGELVDSAGDNLMRHSSTVTFLSVLMGLKLEGYLVRQRKHIDPARAKEVTNLGVGAMLHDLGITQLPTDVRENYKKTNNDTDPLWREHPTLGYNLVRGRVEPSAATVVLNHHQRFDGSGYAGSGAPPLDGQRIHVFARIVGLAEEFERLKNPPHLPSQPTVWALRMLLEPGMINRFDPQVLWALFTVVPAYPPGSIVRLSDGQWAVSIDHNVDDPCRPQVQIIPDPKRLTANQEFDGPVLDLSHMDRRLSVAEIDGQDVSGLNFETPRRLREMSMMTWA